jgi:hypothetical protein
MNMTQQDLKVLQSLLRQIEAIKLPEEHAKMVDPAQRFHARLFHAAGAPMMYRLALQSVHHTNVFLSSLWFTNRRIAYVGKEYFAQLYEACAANDIDLVGDLIRGYRVDMAGVVLRDRVRTDDLTILPGVLTQAELLQLRAIVDDGQDPIGPAGYSSSPTPRQRTGISNNAPSVNLDTKNARIKGSPRGRRNSTLETA